MVGPTRMAGWHPLFLNRERVQDSFSDPISLGSESVIFSVQGTGGLRYRADLALTREPSTFWTDLEAILDDFQRLNLRF